MRAAWQILYKMLLQQFYQQHAGMFLFAFLFFFGIVDAGHLISYHRSLMPSMISLPLFLHIVMLLWLLYNIKTIMFCNRVITAADGSFIFRLRALPPLMQYALYAGAGIVLYLPVMIYGSLLAVFAFGIDHTVTWQVAIWLLLMILLQMVSLFTCINKTSVSFFATAGAALQKVFGVRTGYYAFGLSYLLHERKAAFAIVKVFSLLLLAMLLVRNADSFDTDLFAIFFPLSIMAHASLVFHFVDFNESLLHNSRNLPLHWLQVSAMYLLTYCIILLPEIFFLFINNHHHLPMVQLAMQSVTAIAVLFLFTGMAMGCGLNMERYLLFAFMVYISVLILQKAFGHVIAASFLSLLAAMVFRAHYYSFEREQQK